MKYIVDKINSRLDITEENINRYIANVQKGRAMRKKK